MGALSVVDSPWPGTGPALQVQGLRVALTTGEDVVTGVDLVAEAGEILGLVGESGSGKTTIASALLGHARPGARIAAGQVWIGGVDILAESPASQQRLRGRAVSYVPQDPGAALNPLRRVGDQLAEVLAVHAPHLSPSDRRRRIAEVARDVGLPVELDLGRRFPHQLSGGQQQRVLLALAFVLRPRLIVLDEPTTALDVSTQAQILTTIRALCRSYGAAALYVSHDLAVVRALADRVVVLYAGRVVEAGPGETLFAAPAHPYTRGLMAAIPAADGGRDLQPIAGQAPSPAGRPRGCAFAPRCPRRQEHCAHEVPPLVSARPSDAAARVACFHPHTGDAEDSAAPPFSREPVERTLGRPGPLLDVRELRASYGQRQVLFDVSFELEVGGCLALVGESGSGKTTLARSLAGVGRLGGGEVFYGGQPLSLRARRRSPELHREIQYIYQNPYRALNPRRTVGEIVGGVVRHFFAVDPSEARRRTQEALDRVALPPSVAAAHPRELSGGERQRVAIARALVCQPRLLICDEVTSALDVSVQATVLQLLRGLQQDGVALLFVTHDLGVVQALADRVVVLYRGRVVEEGSVDAVLARPSHAYTRALVRDSPSLRRVRSADSTEKNNLAANDAAFAPRT